MTTFYKAEADPSAQSQCLGLTLNMYTINGVNIPNLEAENEDKKDKEGFFEKQIIGTRFARTLADREGKFLLVSCTLHPEFHTFIIGFYIFV